MNATVGEVMKKVRQRTVLNISVANREDEAIRTLESHPMVENVDSGDGKFVVTLVQSAEEHWELNQLLINEGYKVTFFGEERVDLEAAFMALTRGMGEKN